MENNQRTYEAGDKHRIFEKLKENYNCSIENKEVAVRYMTGKQVMEFPDNM